jgi:shikimate kinase
VIDSTIVLIGHVRAGKTVVGKLLAERLGIPRFSLDDERWKYYAEIGYDESEASRIAKSSDGIISLLSYWKPFEAHAVERVLADHPGSVLDFGAGHSVYTDEELFSRVQRALAPYPNVIMLLPTPDLDESVRILNERFSQLLET